MLDLVCSVYKIEIILLCDILIANVPDRPKWDVCFIEVVI